MSVEFCRLPITKPILRVSLYVLSTKARTFVAVGRWSGVSDQHDEIKDHMS